MTTEEIDWRHPPACVAPSAEDKTKEVVYEISKRLYRGRGRPWLSTPLFQIWTHLHGQLPPFRSGVKRVLDDCPQLTLCTLQSATACFEGVKRPHNKDNNGETVLTYCLRIVGSMESFPRMPVPVRGFLVPEKVIFTVQVTPYSSPQGVASKTHGMVTRIEPVRCSEEDPDLPFDFSRRYGKRLW